MALTLIKYFKFSAPFRDRVKRKLNTKPSNFRLPQLPFSFPIPKGWEKERLRPTNQKCSKFSAPFRAGVKRKFTTKPSNFRLPLGQGQNENTTLKLEVNEFFVIRKNS
jgi:hypothetical protein